MTRLERTAHVALIAIGIIAGAVALRPGEDFLALIARAFVVGIVLSPVSGALDRLGLRRSAASLMSFGFTICVIVLIVAAVQPIIARAIEVFRGFRESCPAAFTRSSRNYAGSSKSSARSLNRSTRRVPERGPAPRWQAMQPAKRFCPSGTLS